MAGGIGGGSGAGDKDDEGNIKPKDQQQTFGTAKGGNVTPGLPMVQNGDWANSASKSAANDRADAQKVLDNPNSTAEQRAVPHKVYWGV